MVTENTNRNKEIAEMYYANHIAYSNAGQYLIRIYHLLTKSNLETEDEVLEVCNVDKDYSWKFELIRPALHNLYFSIELGLKAIIIAKNKQQITSHDIDKLVEEIDELEEFKGNETLKKLPQIILLTRYIFKDHLDGNEIERYMNSAVHMGNRFNLINFYSDISNQELIKKLQNKIDHICKKLNLELK